jgi:hypothetical protein
MSYRLCLWCLANKNESVVRQPDRPCPQCKYMGDWDGTPVFVHPPHYSLIAEAADRAKQQTEWLMATQEPPQMN